MEGFAQRLYQRFVVFQNLNIFYSRLYHRGFFMQLAILNARGIRLFADPEKRIIPFLKRRGKNQGSLVLPSFSFYEEK